MLPAVSLLLVLVALHRHWWCAWAIHSIDEGIGRTYLHLSDEQIGLHERIAREPDEVRVEIDFLTTSDRQSRSAADRSASAA
jgi:hypothetical protein